YDWIVKQGGDPSRIRFKIEGAGPYVDAAGSLVLKTPAGEVRQRKPAVYQGDRKIDCRFVVRGKTVSFNVAAYDRSRQLVIDPVLVYSTYMGGSNGDVGRGIAVDGGGNAYVTGYTASTNFPSANPLQAANGGGTDAFVTKISADGSAKLYSTYLGGSGSDFGTGIAVDGSGNAYVTGYTGSTNFPTASPLQAANGGGNDAFVTKLNNLGSTKLYSTYLGGSGTDQANSIAVDGSGNAYVTGYTGSTNFPTANPLQAANGGGDDTFIAKISADGSTKLYSTYLGGSSDEGGGAIAVDGSGNAYV